MVFYFPPDKVLYSVNGNTYKLCFWALCHILSDKELHDAIKAEIDPEGNDREPSMDHLIHHCPLLDSVICEVLRLYPSSTSMRFIHADTEIGGNILRKGNRIMLPYRTLHENADIYGHDSQRFQPGRFLKTSSLKRSFSYRPFGGGATLCAGRFLAQQEVLRFIGTALYLYEMEPVLQDAEGRPQQPFPRVDDKTPTFGMMTTLGGDDFEILIRQRR